MLSSYDKALELNLDPTIYGTFAEIGAGQETANWFFRVSGTAGMVAKSISAYDMVMSDAIYGKTDRYVSDERLNQMLRHEYGILLERLGEQRGKDTRFFSFCNTVRARGYRDSGECHGWLGVRFQKKPQAPPSEVTLHVRLLDHRTIDQMEALGVVGLNLIHSIFRKRNNLREFIESLLDNLTRERIEVTMLKFTGHGYEDFDNRICALQLVQSGLTDAAMLLPSGEVVEPADALYKKPVLLLRGSFDPVLNLHLSMLEQSRRSFCALLDCPNCRDLENCAECRTVVELCEISMANLLRGEAELDLGDFLDRADALQALGKTVLVSSCAEFHRISAFLNRCTRKPVGIILSIGLLNELFKQKWYGNLAGGLLESFGRLFKQGVSLQVFPWKNRRSGELVTAQTFQAPENCLHLYQHFLENGHIQEVVCDDESLLEFTSRDVLRLIAKGDPRWRQLVPECAWEMAERHAHRQRG